MTYLCWKNNHLQPSWLNRYWGKYHIWCEYNIGLLQSTDAITNNEESKISWMPEIWQQVGKSEFLMWCTETWGVKLSLPYRPRCRPSHKTWVNSVELLGIEEGGSLNLSTVGIIPALYGGVTKRVLTPALWTSLCRPDWAGSTSSVAGSCKSDEIHRAQDVCWMPCQRPRRLARHSANVLRSLPRFSTSRGAPS